MPDESPVLSDQGTCSECGLDFARFEQQIGQVAEIKADRDRLRAENEALRKIIPSKYDLGAAIYYLESHELRCKYDKGTSDATRAEIHRLIDDLKVFRHAVHMPDATAVALDEQEASNG